MSAGYRAVQWSAGKRTYDLTLATLLGLFLAVFFIATVATRPEITIETALLRAFGTAALALLHLVIAIGPLARLDRRFLPLLWNRRHLGVTMFLCALVHGALALLQFHAFGDRTPLVSLLVSNRRFDSLAHFPFQPLGALALVILFLMAATSHDFWLRNLTAPVWKALHLGVYFAWALIVAHVALGVLQDERAPALALVVAGGVAGVLALHLAAALRERRIDRARSLAAEDGFVEVSSVEEIAEGRAKVVSLAGERVAIFRYQGRISALSNVCQHQNGPLGEGKIVDGCIICPWHGYQYRPEDGASPAPFTEKVPTFRVRVVDSRILVDPRPLAPGTRVEPSVFDPDLPARQDRQAFFVGYLPFPGPLKSFHRGVIASLASLLGLLALTLGSGQRALGSGVFEFGIESELTGILRLDPVASIWTAKAGGGGATGFPLEVVPIVGEFKHGAPARILSLAGQEVRATGTWVRRGTERLFEVADAAALGAGAIEPEEEGAGVSLGPVHLTGEIVDAKCWLGVMKPAAGKSHKACAVRCLSGGVPAAFVVRSASDRLAVLWMVAPTGKPLGPQLLDLVAEPVEIDGELVRVDGRAILVTDRAGIRRSDGSGS